MCVVSGGGHICWVISGVYFWPHDGNEKGRFEARYLGVHISGVATAMKKADSRQDISRQYFCPRDGNEKGRFEAKYLAPIYLASRRQ